MYRSLLPNQKQYWFRGKLFKDPNADYSPYITFIYNGKTVGIPVNENMEFAKRLDERPIDFNIDLHGADSITIYELDVSKVGDMSHKFQKYINYTFPGNWDTSSVKNMYYMFANNYRQVSPLDLSGWNTSNVEDIGGLFVGCERIEGLNLSGWDLAKVSEINSPFRGCESLKYLNLSNWKIQNVKLIISMCENCLSLETLDLSGWDLTSMEAMPGTLTGCESLKYLNLSNWKVSSHIVSYMRTILSGTKNLETLDLSGWDLTGITTFSKYTFKDHPNLKTVYLRGCNEYTIEKITPAIPEGCEIITN